MARGAGQRRLNTWNRCAADLRLRRCRFRIRRRTGRPDIWVRELGEGGKVLREFKAGSFLADLDADIELVYRRCIQAGELGRWPDAVDNRPSETLSWPEFAQLVRQNLQQRIPKRSSRAHAEGHLRTFETFAGPVSALQLERWVCELDPVAQPSPFRKRLETLAQIQSSGLMDLQQVLARLRALRPKGTARRRQVQATMRPRAIPSDAALQAWLDGLTGMEQWVFALIATYGLRPSEAWHAEGIDAQGWITIPGEGRTKTARHYAPPVPAHWVQRYKLAKTFNERQKQLLDRWPLKWEERDGISFPVNNSSVSNYLHKLQRDRPQPNGTVYPAQITPLMAKACDSDGSDWVRPYDLRHAYAIRCFSDAAVNMLPTDDHAQWMGHGVDVHERIYLKWMPAARQKAALQERHARLSSASAEPEALTPAELPPEILARLAKLEQLEKLLSS